jgi:hypothetical protein
MALQPKYYQFNQTVVALRRHMGRQSFINQESMVVTNINRQFLARCVNELKQGVQCNVDVTPMTFTRTS